jgi:hypothetical protein
MRSTLARHRLQAHVRWGVDRTVGFSLVICDAPLTIAQKELHACWLLRGCLEWNSPVDLSLKA